MADWLMSFIKYVIQLFCRGKNNVASNWRLKDGRNGQVITRILSIWQSTSSRVWISLVTIRMMIPFFVVEKSSERLVGYENYSAKNQNKKQKQKKNDHFLSGPGFALFFHPPFFLLKPNLPPTDQKDADLASKAVHRARSFKVLGL